MNRTAMFGSRRRKIRHPHILARSRMIPLLLVSCIALVGMHSASRGAPEPMPSSALSPQIWGDWEGTWYIYGESFHWPVLGQNQDGRLELFVAAYSDSLTNHSVVYHLWQTAPNASWIGGDTLGQNIAFLAPAAGQNLDGRMEVFAQNLWYGFGSPPCSGPHYEVSHIWQTAPNNGWSDWAELNQPSCSVDLDIPYIGTNADGRMDVFAKGSDHAVWHRWQTATSSGWTSGWTSIGKPAALSDVSPVMSIGRMQDGRLVLFALGSDYEIYQNWQTTAGDETNWSGWVGFGAPQGISLSSPVVNQNADGRLQFFTAGSDGAIWSKWQVAPDSYWSGWGSLGKPLGIHLSDPVVGRHLNGTLEVFSTGDDYDIWHIGQTAPNGGWSSWANLGKPTVVNFTNQLAVGRNQNGTLIIFVVTTDGGLWWKAEKLAVYLPLLSK